jgi:hypothetical protein
MSPLDLSFPNGLSSFLLIYSARASVTSMLFPVIVIGTLSVEDDDTMESALWAWKAIGLVKADAPARRRKADTIRMFALSFLQFM